MTVNPSREERGAWLLSCDCGAASWLYWDRAERAYAKSAARLHLCDGSCPVFLFDWWSAWAVVDRAFKAQAFAEEWRGGGL